VNKDWYYRKWERLVITYLPRDVVIESIVPSVWHKAHVQVTYEQDGKRFCEQIPESEILKEQTK
jgi:hypothetical protein